jgi:hypothetical protein
MPFREIDLVSSLEMLEMPIVLKECDLIFDSGELRGATRRNYECSERS